MKPAVLSIAVAAGLPFWAGSAFPAELTPREIYEQRSPAVVMVMGHSSEGRRGSGGTGSIIRQDGLVLTNAHVVLEEGTGKPYPRLTVYLKPDRVTGDPRVDLSRGVKARVVAVSQPLDLAVLQLEGTTRPLPVLELGDSEGTKIGDRVVAIGHPEQGGLWTLTTGTISAEFENFQGTPGKSVFQTETGLNRGNSGGPLLDASGRMIGVNTAIARVAPDGLPITSISFSLKSSVAKRWLREQGVGLQQPLASSDTSDKAGERSLSLPSGQPVLPTHPPAASKAAPSPPSTRSAPQTTTPSRPYNLDRLINERSQAEADLEDMIKDMRGKLGGR
ncbi:S1C family serine protease [Nitrospira calida]|jgi:serine protease Do